tara:strand:+ start:2455 stop:2859 length:405 start_codon:yes stop_codon:yes gene_type:complete
MVYEKKNIPRIFNVGETRSEKKWNNRRFNCLMRSHERCSMVCVKSCLKYRFTKEELLPILDAMLEYVEEQYANGYDPENPYLYLDTIERKPYTKKKEKENIYTIQEESDEEDMTDTETNITTDYDTDISELSYL